MLFNGQLFNPKKISYDTKKEKKLMLINQILPQLYLYLFAFFSFQYKSNIRMRVKDISNFKSHTPFT